MSYIVSSEKEDIRIPLPITEITSTSSNNPTQIFGMADPNLSKAVAKKLFAINSDTVAHTLTIGIFNTSSSVFYPYYILNIDAGTSNVFGERDLIGFYAQGENVIASYVDSVPSSGIVGVSLEVKIVD